MFWMAKVPDNNSEVYDAGDRRLTELLCVEFVRQRATSFLSL